MLIVIATAFKEDERRNTASQTFDLNGLTISPSLLKTSSIGELDTGTLRARPHEYQSYKYEYEYKYPKFVLELYSSTSSLRVPEYYISAI